MTNTMNNSAGHDTGFFTRLGTALLDLMGRVGERSYLSACVREAEALFALSDTELAARGLTRRGILPHVFGGYPSV